ncbi:GNAT family N-acetyltransferase [Muricoccus radiodurans]|uniref:GNAT family N-acetyltransferase n=1 Tax=Muricoccus radiodurans TaxID=2231721 RepID=UPI003CF0E3B4
MRIRDAVPADAPAACDVLIRSITVLCAGDHRNDPAILSRWLANKTPENVAAWIALPDRSFLLATAGQAVLGVGAVTDIGEITLNYVAPENRFRGISKSLIAALEARAAHRGAARLHLHSTGTARRFYRSAGYADDGEPTNLFGLSGFPMSKPLPTSRSPPGP